jgi:hypothetical protein
MVRAMLAAPTIDLTLTPHSSRRQWMPLGLSAFLHLLLALVWLGFPMPEHQPPQDPTIEVELTAEPPGPVPAKPPASASAPAPKPQAATDEGKPIPQLEDGILAQRSSTPKPKEREASAAPPPLHAESAPKPKKPEPVTQNERDFVLGQVLRHWAPPQELSAYSKADVRVTVTVRADGYFDDIYDSRRPWNPAAVFDGYSTLPAGDIQRRTVDAFYRAIRQAQPVRLPAALQAKAPFKVRLDFRFKDAR